MVSSWLPSLNAAISIGLSLLCFNTLPASGFDNTRSDNVAVYWGQDSYGATNSADPANFQQPLAFYCQDDSIDAFPIAFLNVFFGAGGLPSIDLANTCNTADDAVFPGTQLPNCSFLASDIETCQSMGKIVTISLGGATGAAGFTSDAQASAFADTIWDTFLGGSSSTRPFGGAVLDGVDLDIEGGSTIYFDSFVNQLRTLASGANKQYYVTAAPQCPYPDAYLGTVLNEVGFDAVYVQFYNNYCQLTSFSNANDWDFSDWDNWAKTVAINKDVKIYIGAPASSSAAGSGYVDVNTLANIALTTRSQYSSFGGVMLWDASQAYANDRFDAAIKSAIIEGSGGSSSSIPVTVTTSTQSASSSAPSTTTLSTISSSAPSTTTLSTISTTTTSTLSAPTGAGNCAGVNAWVANVAYIGGDEVVYNGHLWTAKWWSYADIPGGVAGDWTDDGACVAAALRVGQFITAHYESKSVPLTIPAKATSAP